MIMACCDCVFFDDPQFCPYYDQNPEFELKYLELKEKYEKEKQNT